MDKKLTLLFIAGLHRSGTSVLHEIIREHPDVLGLKNTDAPEDEGQHIQNVYEPAYKYGGPGKFVFDRRAYMDENHYLVSQKNANKIYNQWLANAADIKNETFFVEKSPPNIIRTKFLNKLFPYSKFLILLRNPIAVAYATQKWAKTPILSLIEHTLLAYKILFDDLNTLSSPHYILRYENFVSNPQQNMDDVYDFLRISKQKNFKEIRPDVNQKYIQIWENEKSEIM
ncbi:MAG: sulfotransferase family protein, partial [Bacteroidota bacterium]